MVWSAHVSKSSHPRIDRTLSVRGIVMSCFRLYESPKFGIVLRSSNRRSRDRRNHVVPKSKPNPASPRTTLKMKPFLAFLIKMFFSTLSWFYGLVCPSFKIWPSTYRSYVVSTKNCLCTCPLKLLKLYRSYVVSTSNGPYSPSVGVVV